MIKVFRSLVIQTSVLWSLNVFFSEQIKQYTTNQDCFSWRSSFITYFLWSKLRYKPLIRQSYIMIKVFVGYQVKTKNSNYNLSGRPGNNKSRIFWVKFLTEFEFLYLFRDQNSFILSKRNIRGKILLVIAKHISFKKIFQTSFTINIDIYRRMYFISYVNIKLVQVKTSLSYSYNTKINIMDFNLCSVIFVYSILYGLTVYCNLREPTRNRSINFTYFYCSKK